MFHPAIGKCISTYKCLDRICVPIGSQVCARNIFDPNTFDCTTYVKCVEKGTECLATLRTCAAGKLFNGQTCVASSKYTCTV